MYIYSTTYIPGKSILFIILWNVTWNLCFRINAKSIFYTRHYNLQYQTYTHQKILTNHTDKIMYFFLHIKYH